MFFWQSSLFKSQLVKEGEDFLLKKAPQKILRVSHPTRISPFMVPTRKEAPTRNAPMGAIPLKAVTNRFPQTEKNTTSEAPGVVFDPTIGEESTSRRSPPFFQKRRDWQHYHQWLHTAIPLKTNLVRFPLILSEYKALQKDQALADCI